MRYLSRLSFALIVTGCATSDDATTAPETSNPDTTDPTMESMEADPAVETTPASDPATSGTTAPTPPAPTPTSSTPQLAALPAPSVTLGGTSTATVTTSLAGPGVQINGSTNYDGYALVSYRITTNAMAATAEFTVNPAPNAAFVYSLAGGGGGYSSKLLRLERVPGSDNLRASTPTGKVVCGALPSNQSTAVTLAFDGTTKTFDVLLGGSPSGCMGLATQVIGPVTGFRLMDATNMGYGGRVDFSNLTLLY